MVLKVVNAELVSREITAIREECSAGSVARGGGWRVGWSGCVVEWMAQPPHDTERWRMERVWRGLDMDG